MGVNAEPELAANASKITRISFRLMLSDNVSGTMTIKAISFVTNIDRKNVVSTNFNGIAFPFSMLWAICNMNPVFCKPFTATNNTNRMNNTCISLIE